MDLSQKLGFNTLRYHFLPYCNLDTLLRLNHVCRGFRMALNNPEVISDWLTTCWWTQPRHCLCDRRQFLIEVERWCPFMWDYRGTGSHTDDLEGCLSIRDVQLVLRNWGRSIPMMLQSLERPMRMRPIPYPRNHCACLFDVAQRGSGGAVFCPGMHSEMVEMLLVPLPRMLTIPVERARLGRTAMDVETDMVWGRFHEVTDAMLEENEDAKWNKQEVPPCLKGVVYPTPTEFDDAEPDYEDRVVAYMARCRAEGVDPHDPGQDNENMDGYRAEQWARRLLYESAVGLQTYPLYLCVHRDDLRGSAHRLGPVYIDRHFVSSLVYEGHQGELSLLGQNGEVLLNNVRYDNQAGDFTSWCLSTMGTLNAVYHHLWHDYARMWLRHLRLYLLGLVSEIQSDLPMSQLVPAWQRMLGNVFLHQPFEANIPHPQSRKPPNKREKAAVQFIMDQSFRREFMVVQRYVEEWLHRPLTQSRMFREPYLRNIVPDEHWNGATYPEHALVQDVERLMNLSEYLLGFSELLGPRLDQNTVFLRRRMHRLYLNSGLSLLLWAPHWQRPFPDGWRHIHTEPHTEVPLRMLHLNVANNHRYVDYLRFLNTRALYHNPQFDAWHLAEALRQDVGRTLRA